MTGSIEKLRSVLFTRRHDYRVTFNGPRAENVLRDLARFCRAHETTVHSDRDAMLVLEGRREVWLRVQHHLELTPEQLWSLYSGRTGAIVGEGND